MEKTTSTKTGTVELFLELEKGGLRFLVIGGFASNLYGVQRATYDIDLAVAPDPESIATLIVALRRAGYTDVLDINTGKKIATIKNITPEKVLELESVRVKNKREVDLLIVPSPQFDYLWKHKFDVEYEGIKIPLPNPVDLIHMKEQSPRQVDLEDAKILRHLLRSRKAK